MLNCPKCQKPVEERALSCPNCDNPLKAFGHPGIPLYQSTDASSLCDRCTYHLDDTCNFPKRPNAKSCTLYHDASKPLVEVVDPPQTQLSWRRGKNWLYRYRGILAIAFLIIVSVAIAL